MAILTTPRRLFINASKQIRRSGWLGGGSILVMVLVFLLGTVFLGLAYASNLYLQSIENEPHIYVFFYTGTNADNIMAVKNKIEVMPEIYYVDYTDEEAATKEYIQDLSRKDPEQSQYVRKGVVPPSLGIRLNKIDDVNKMIDILNVEKSQNKSIFRVAYTQEVIDTFKNLLYWVRLGGIVLLGLLLFVLFLFALLTVEFRIYNRAEEISIMQLVGGSLWFIRAPFILEGAFYGFVGALISNVVVFGLGYFVFVVNRTSAETTYIISQLADLNWPALTEIHFILGFIGILFLGMLIGAFNSLIAIRRYIY